MLVSATDSNLSGLSTISQIISQSAYDKLQELLSAGNLVDIGVNPYIATINRNVVNVDYSKLMSGGVSGIIVEAGYYFDMIHLPMSVYQNPNLKAQLKQISEYKLPFGLFTYMRARSIEEAKKEVSSFVNVLRKYPPTLGVWLFFQTMTSNKTVNDAVIETYYASLVKNGFVGQIGIRATRDQVPFMSWDKFCTSMYMWIVDHVDSLDDFQHLLDPTFFDVEVSEG